MSDRILIPYQTELYVDQIAAIHQISEKSGMQPSEVLRTAIDAAAFPELLQEEDQPLRRTKANAPVITELPPIFGIATAAAYLGVSEDTIRTRVQEIPHRNIGKRITFTRETFMNWYLGGFVEPKKN